MKLYELADMYEELINAEMDPEDLEAAMDAIGEEAEDKIEHLAVCVKELTAEAAALKAEADALTERRMAKQNKAERIKDYLTAQMNRLGLKKLDRPKACVSFRTSKSVWLDDPIKFCQWARDNQREDLLLIKEDPSKVEIKRNIEAGNYIPFAEIREKTSAVIK